jgi:hypothetical protein
VDKENVPNVLKEVYRRQSDLVLLCAVGILYSLFRIPLIFDEIPGWYRAGVQLITFSVAVGTAKTGLPPEFVIRQSFSGANLHGMFGAVVPLLGIDLRFVRVLMFLFGFLTLYFTYDITRKLGMSRFGQLGTLALLTLTPHFVLFTGYATPMAVTLCFATGSVYAYIRFSEAGPSRYAFWGLLSGCMAGLATLNHFWGGIATVTVGLLSGASLLGLYLRSDTERARAGLKKTAVLWGEHVLTLVPAGILYVYYRTQLVGEAKEIFQHYGGYTITSAPGTLLQIETYLVYVYWILMFAPLLPIAIALLAISYKRSDTKFRPSKIVESNALRPTTDVFWGIWLITGLSIVVLFPRGARIHDYYLWWTVVPTAGLIAWALESEALQDLGFSQQIPTDPKVIIAVLLVVSAAFSGFQVGRAYFDPGVPTLMGSNPPPDTELHSQTLAEELDAHVKQEDGIIIYEEGVRIRTAMVLSGNVEIRRVTFARSASSLSGKYSSRCNVLVATKELSDILTAGWELIEVVQSHGYKTYIYHKTGADTSKGRCTIES